MRDRLRRNARAWMPPAYRRKLRRAADHALPQRFRRWRFLSGGWPDAARNGGWNDAAVAEAYRIKWPAFRDALQGTGPFGVIHEVPLGSPMPTEDVSGELLGVTFSYVLARAALSNSRLRVLDWGGALGHYALIARKNLPELDVDYHVKELPEVCRTGRELVSGVTFHETESCLNVSYDVVFASGALESAPLWQGQLARFATAA